jgi:hypothetical protein
VNGTLGGATFIGLSFVTASDGTTKESHNSSRGQREVLFCLQVSSTSSLLTPGLSTSTTECETSGEM